MKDNTETSSFALLASDDAFDPLEEGVRLRVRAFIETILEEELRTARGRGRYERPAEIAKGHRWPRSGPTRRSSAAGSQASQPARPRTKVHA